jgi:glycosyltransferase involved in cell wall biosynthesis
MKICFVYKHKSSFVNKDIELLSKHFDVTPLQFELNISKICKLFRLIKSNDIIFIWFVSYHAFIVTLMTRVVRRPIIVVTGGYDVAREKEINYGLMLKKSTGWMVRYVLRRASSILAVSEFNQHEVERNTGIKTAKIVYNCIDNQKFIPGKESKQNIVVTVGFVDEENIVRKGLKQFVEAATSLVSYEFIVLGKLVDEAAIELAKSAPSNVKFKGFVSDKELLEHYQKAKVYCQLSYYESYGMALGEAMLCECIPVVTDRGALPEVVSDTGFYAEYGNVSQTISAIEKAMQSQDKGKQARKRIIENFPQDCREKKLKETVEGIYMDRQEEC